MITIDDINITLEYTRANKARRKKICKDIIDNSLASMTIPSNLNLKLELIQKVINTSLLYYEQKQMYECCLIFRDIIKMIKDDYSSNNSEEASLQ